MKEITRRNALGIGFGVVGGVAGGIGAGMSLAPSRASAQVAQQDEYDELRLRWRDLMTGGDFDAADPVYQPRLAELSATADELSETMVRGSGRTHLWPDLPLTDPESADASTTYTRLQDMALAWATPGTDQHDDQSLVEDIVSALDFMYANAYNESMPEVGNWWGWEIGRPRSLARICTLVYDHLTSDQLVDYFRAIDAFCPNPDRRTSNGVSETGGNRADKALIVAMRGLLGKSSDKLVLARDGLSDVRDNGQNSVFQLTTSGSGLYPDGSYVFHTDVAYTGTYGNVLLGRVADMVALLGGSTWEVTDPDLTILLDAVEHSFEPVTFNGLMMDCVRGRSISRQTGRDYVTGRGTTSNVLMLAAGAPAAYADRYRALAKGWIQRNTTHPYLDSADIPAISLAKEVLDDSSIPAAPGSVGGFVFAGMDRIVHRRPDWAFAISMSSERIAAYETINGENLRGWYTGEGMTYLYNDDLAQFNDDFWPTVDPYRLPGTTVDTRQRADMGSGGKYKPDTRWVGGAVLDDRFIGAGQFTKCEGTTLRSKKSWYCVDDAVIALGAGIQSGDGRRIETIVENRNLHAAGVDALTVDGVEQPVEQGWSETFDGAGWAHLAGVGGYVFPGGAELHALREERTGSWWDISQGTDVGDPTPITRRYVTLWYDHGSNPSQATYAYVLLPGATAAQTAARAADLGVEILVNDLYLQAVEVRDFDLVAANFWVAGAVPVTDPAGAELTADAPAAVVVRRVDGEIRVAVADPMRTTTQTITVELPYAASSVVSADPTVTVTTGARPTIRVSVSGSLDASHQAVLQAA